VAPRRRLLAAVHWQLKFSILLRLLRATPINQKKISGITPKRQ
jgi:hypothetical protein